MATTPMSVDDLQAALPNLTSTLRLSELEHPVQVYRDRLGIPHVRAQSVHDAFFAQGFAHAQDRFWQMDYDRHRAYGRAAEYLGAGAVPLDALLRRLRLEASARADYDAVQPETRTMLDAYAAGVNAFLQTATRLPIEYQVLDSTPEPWQPWDACAVFKLRHVFTGGVWQGKLWRARLLRQLGPELTAKLYADDSSGQPLIIPPDAEHYGPALSGLDVLHSAKALFDTIDDLDGGSNSWVLHGHRTASGSPLLAGDPHRALDTPNVYYQNHLACPDFDTIGLSFPGVPGFPHFGHNRAVAWCVTTAMTDYQDLYIERFHPSNPQLYEFKGEWLQVQQRREVLLVRSSQPVEFETRVTQHGPVIVGDPAQGYALAWRSTATVAPNATFDSLLPMLRAHDADEFEAALRPWVDPCNNILFADVHGHIGYRTRGQVPIRSRANAWLPVPGWTGEHEWQGVIPFEAMPRLRDPEAGLIVTANNRIVDDAYPHYLALHYEPGFRARRIRARLLPLREASGADMAGTQADRVSIPAQAFVAALGRVHPANALVAQAKSCLQEWDGTMAPDSVAAAVYAVCREQLMRLVMEPLLGPLAREALGGGLYGTLMPLSQLRARLLTMIQADDRTLLPAGGQWTSLLDVALARTVGWLRRELGDDPQRWQWGRLHRTTPRHPLVAVLPELADRLNPPSAVAGGDGDTIQAASISPGTGYTVGSTSVTRFVFDLSDWQRSAWVVPLGASGHPGSPHYADQATTWAAVQLYPMLYDWTQISAEAETLQGLEPSG
ncbi:MAG TPA: penicillin acylase family protein [Candidatus Tectomicrobia bacterium]|nr:penicillin acylase family protein [Candidatus Tectomicrobia bacterium]